MLSMARYQTNQFIENGSTGNFETGIAQRWIQAMLGNRHHKKEEVRFALKRRCRISLVGYYDERKKKNYISNVKLRSHRHDKKHDDEAKSGVPFKELRDRYLRTIRHNKCEMKKKE